MASSSSLTRGALIVIEGIDRVGKSTLCQSLISLLTAERPKVELIRFPCRSTNIGKFINNHLTSGGDVFNDQTIHLLFSANRWEMKETMTDKLIAGTTLIVDRYSYSGVAYSAAKKKMSIDWCKAPEKGLIKPDLIIYLTADPEVIAKRPGFGDEVYEKKSFQVEVAAMYEQLMEKDWKAIDANKSPEEVLQVALEEIRKTIDNVSDKPLLELWMKE